MLWCRIFSFLTENGLELTFDAFHRIEIHFKPGALLLSVVVWTTFNILKLLHLFLSSFFIFREMMIFEITDLNVIKVMFISKYFKLILVNKVFVNLISILLFVILINCYHLLFLRLLLFLFFINF